MDNLTEKLNRIVNRAITPTKQFDFNSEEMKAEIATVRRKQQQILAMRINKPEWLERVFNV
jgi:hypothetical protein